MTEYISFSVAGQLMGIPVLDVREVLNPQPVLEIPHSMSGLAGLINVRGQIATAISLRQLLGSPGTGIEEPMNVIVPWGDELLSFLVDSVGDVFSVPEDRILPVPGNLDGMWLKCANGIHRIGDALLVIVSAGSILTLFETA